MEHFIRSEAIIGKEKLDRLKKASVLLVGIGGVGGITLEMLVRSGVGNISIIDYDVFEESNLNRQTLSLSSNVGKSKVEEAKKRMLCINPYCSIKTFNIKVTGDFLDDLNNGYDYVIDACDDVKAKVALVNYAINNKIKIISCCGTGNRLFPENLCITNVWKTEYDPLAKKLRGELRKSGINYKLPVVCSKEKPVIKTNGSVGSMPMVPNAAGILLASYVINCIIKED